MPGMDMVAYISRADFRAWAEQQPSGRYERVDGRVVKMTPERIVHVELKAAVWQALKAAVRAAGVDCHAYGDGVTVEVGEDTDYEPDAVINAGARPRPSDVAAPNPIVVVEVLSPGTRSIDTGAKFSGYFRVPSIQHYLIVSALRREVVHHRRAGDAIVSAVVTEGAIVLDPPGISVTIDEIYRDVTL
jgi:Uma2 family endonuclease